MSFQAMTWAVEQKCGSAAAKLVLLMLANHANGHTGRCNPRHKRLAEECEMRVETLKNHLKALADLGLVTIVPQFAEGVQLPNQYLLNMDATGSDSIGGGGEKRTGGGGEKRTGGGGEKRPPNNQEVNQEDNHSLSPDKSDDGGQPGGEEKKDTGLPKKTAAIPDCPHIEIIELFGQHLPMLPQPKPELWSGARATALKARWRRVLTAKKRDGKRYAETREQALDWFGRFFGYVSQSDFLTGRDGKWTGCDLGWLCSESNFAKVVQGNYDNRDAAA